MSDVTVDRRRSLAQRVRASDRSQQRTRWAEAFALHVVAGVVAIALASLLVMLLGGSPRDVSEALYNGSLAKASSIGRTLDEAAPLLIVAIGAIVSTRASLFNIGQEGQLLAGAITGGAVALFMPGPGPLVLVAALVAAALGGAIWSGIPALLFYRFKLSVVLTTLLFTFVAAEMMSFAVGRTYLLQETREDGGVKSSTSDALRADVRLPRLGSYPGLNVSSGVIIAVVLTIVMAVMLGRSRWGMRLRLLGSNPQTARRFGIRAAVMGSAALMISGAFAGLAGGVVLTGTSYRVQTGIANNLGYEGLLVALVARRRPGIAVPVALVFGALRAGGGFLAATGVPREIVGVVQALVALAAVFPPAFEQVLDRRRSKQVARSALSGTPKPVVAPAPAREQQEELV